MLELTAAEVDARQFEALATDGQGSLRAVMAKDDGPARWSVDFWVTDADDVAARVPELGGSVVVEPFESIPTRQAVGPTRTARCLARPRRLARVTRGGKSSLADGRGASGE